MTFSARKRVHLGLIAKVIGRSPIMAAGLLRCTAARGHAVLDLPMGYEAGDLFILDWLAAEAVRRPRHYLPL